MTRFYIFRDCELKRKDNNISIIAEDLKKDLKSEIFKPIIVDRMIFTMLNRGEITEKDFDKKSNFIYLKESSRKRIVEKYDNRLQDTIKHRELGRNVSYQYLMRLEGYKLIKHIIGEKEYKAFRMWW